MPRFFIQGPVGDTAVLRGDDAKHISKVLRMGAGDELTLCDMSGLDYRAVIETAGADCVIARVAGSMKSAGEPGLRVRLYQALPKSDKLELIVQKTVELGVDSVVPVLTRRCVARPDKASMQRKLERCRRVAYEAAKQSGRGLVPEILEFMEFSGAVEQMSLSRRSVILYENSVTPLSAALSDMPQTGVLSVMSGPEGGFEPEEIGLASSLGVANVSLGSRILRCETAPIAVLAALMHRFGEM